MGEKIIPEFLFNNGYAFWENAAVGFFGSKIVSPEINFKYSMNNLRDINEREFMKSLLLKLEERVFGYLKNGNQNLDKHKWMMEHNYFVDLNTRIKDEKGIEKMFHKRADNGTKQIETFDNFFKEVDNFLNALPSHSLLEIKDKN